MPKRPPRFDLVERALRVRCKEIRDARDHPVLAVAYCGMLRHSELVSFEVADFLWDETDDSALIAIQCYKTDPLSMRRRLLKWPLLQKPRPLPLAAD